MKSKIDIACEWAVNIANDPAHGYDNVNRNGPDYDCVSLLVHAWRQAGVEIKASGSASFHTRAFEAGFIDVTKLVNLETGEGTRKGDLMVRRGEHCAMVVDNQGTLVEAMWNELGLATGGEPGDQTGREIIVHAWRQNKPPWDCVCRWPHIDADKTTVISANRFLSYDEMKINAVYVAAYLIGNGWSLQAVAGILGNMQHESTINPGIWQNLDEGNMSGGYGLVQWTPPTKLFEWAESEGLVSSDIDTQLQRILYEKDNGIQYYPVPAYNYSFAEFATSTRDPYELACAFAWNYERSWTVLYGTEAEREALRQQRGGSAVEWYTYLAGVDFPAIPSPNVGKMPKLLMYFITMEG